MTVGLTLCWLAVATTVYEKTKKKVIRLIESLRNEIRMACADRNIERKGREATSYRLVELQLLCQGGGRPSKTEMKCALEHLARIFYERHEHVLFAQKGRVDPDSWEYRQLNDSVKEARSAYWDLAEKLEKAYEYPKKESWREDLPYDLQEKESKAA